MSSKLKQITGLTIRDFGIGMLNISHSHEEFIPDLRQECSNDVTIEILLQSDLRARTIES